VEGVVKERPLPRVLVFSRIACGRHLTGGGEVDTLISIGDPWQVPPAGYDRAARRLRLQFQDVDGEGPGVIAASAADIAKLCDFAGVVRRAGGTAVIHCEAGISRSTAAAYIVFAVMFGAGREGEALDATLAAAPHAMPNRWMVRLADDRLVRGGRLVAGLSAKLY
jgi:predicted protein tyrosine phosphatase